MEKFEFKVTVHYYSLWAKCTQLWPFTNFSNQNTKNGARRNEPFNGSQLAKVKKSIPDMSLP